MVTAGLVNKAKAHDLYDEKTAAKLKAQAQKRAEEQARKAQAALALEARKARAASAAAAQLLQPGGQVHVVRMWMRMRKSMSRACCMLCRLHV